MSTEKTQEDKLRDAANKAYKEHFEACEDKSFAFSKTDWIDGYMRAAKEYHQSLNKVDVKALREDFYKYHFGRQLTVSDIFGWFLLHLQPATESDAVDFAEWIVDNASLEEDGWFCIPTNTINLTSEQLYIEYKQSKTNSDDLQGANNR